MKALAAVSLINRLLCGLLSAGVGYGLVRGGWTDGQALASVALLSLAGAVAHQWAKATAPPGARPIPPSEQARSAGA